MPFNNALALALWQPPQNGLGDIPYLAWPELARTDIHDTPELALLAAARQYPGHDVLLIQTNLALPSGFLSRMRAGWHQYEHMEVLSPLNPEQGLPLPALPAQDIDAMMFLYGEHCIKPVTHWARHGSLWRAAALNEVLAGKHRSLAQLELFVMHGVYVANEFVESKPVESFIGDGKPVVLHVLHSWGGGVEYFARDLRAGDHARHHLLLKAISPDSLPPFGKQLALYQSSSEVPLQMWRLDSQIDDTDIESDEVRKILRQIIDRWGIGAIIVSSLIGHSMDVLKTGLPTVLACHDVYPYWPVLHDIRETKEADFSVEYLAKFLSEDPNGILFKPHSANYWLGIKDHLAETILSREIPCVAPSEYAKKRLCTIEKKLINADWRVIPHGTMRLDRIDTNQWSDPKRKLRVLVPGHLNGDKGESLLVKLLPELPHNIELVLLGCATYLEHKFQHEAVTCYPEYTREDLSAWVAKIQPDIALLPSLVPETFGYVLSEMLAVGLPVLCANIGAYAERAKSFNNVTTVEPNAKAFIEKLKYFRDFRAELQKLAAPLKADLVTLTEVANAWATVSAAKAPNWFFNYSASHQVQEDSAMDRKIDQLIEMSIKTGSVHQEQQRNSAENLERLIEMSIKSGSLHQEQDRKSAENLEQLLISHQQLGNCFEKLQTESIHRDQALVESIEKLEKSLQGQSELKSALLQQQKDFQQEIIELYELQARQKEISANNMILVQKKNDDTLAAFENKILKLEFSFSSQLADEKAKVQLLDQQLKLLNQQLQKTTDELLAVYHSSSWRMTALFRNLKTWFIG